MKPEAPLHGLAIFRPFAGEDLRLVTGRGQYCMLAILICRMQRAR